MQETPSPSSPLRRDSVPLLLAVLLQFALPAALLGWAAVDVLRVEGSAAFGTVLPGMLQGFGVVVATSSALVALSGALIALLAPGGLIERSR